ncbi:MAG: APC family permease, partial [Ilumatobacteraceae bacterium]
MVSLAKRILLGRPIASSEEGHQRLRKRVALPIFASDAISSTAYATDEIVLVLVAQAGIGIAAFSKLVPIAIIVSVLLVIVVLSYRQTIYAYPSGGGAYVVSRENLGELPSLVAGASLMTDYILTVAVSVAGGVLAIQSAFDFDPKWRVPLGLVLIAVMTVANLRGLKESGALFAPPTYLYIVMLVLLIVVGCYRIFVKDLGPIPLDTLSPEAQELAEGGKALGIMMLLRAFSSGAVALSGVEAVSNGVPSFRKPAPRNAATTLAIMAGILGVCFIGVSVLASHLHPLRGEEDATGIALMAEYIYNGKGVLFWITQLATFAILILAANTAYQGFPGLSSIIARDGYLPRQLANRGDKLVYSNGIIFLAVTAGILIIVFKGNISALIPLYAFGVFTGFTLSQAGMIIHHRRFREGRWRVSLVINAVGCVATGIVALVVVVSKFTEGAWVPAVVIPFLVLLFKGINRHYSRLGEQLRMEPEDVPRAEPTRHTMVVLVGSIHQGVVSALRYAASLRPDYLVAVHVAS